MYYRPTMRVQVINPDQSEPAVQLIDSDGREIIEVAAFLRTLTVRRFSPNTVRAYAHDLQKLLSFLDGRVLRSASLPRRWPSSS